MKTTIVGRVPVGMPFLSGVISEGEPVVVLCYGCHQPIIELENPHNGSKYISSSTYTSGSCGVVERGSYGHTDRVYCYCEHDGEFAICWDPQDEAVGCRSKINRAFDYKSFTPELEWFEVGVLKLTDKVFVNSDGLDTTYDGCCMNCSSTAEVSMKYD